MKKNILLSLLLLPLAMSATANAASIGYYRFENGSFLTDSSGNDNTLTVETSPINRTPVEYALPVSGDGSDFFNPVPQNGLANGQAASFDGAGDNGDRFRTNSNSAFLSSTFTLELMFNANNLTNNQLLVGVFDASQDDRAWGLFLHTSGQLQLALSSDGANSSSLFSNTGTASTGGTPTGLTIAADTDYYAAVSVDLSGDVNFYLKNLTTNGSLLTSTFTSPLGSLHTDYSVFSIGAQGSNSGSGSRFGGIIDEVRYSNTVLPQSELLVIPEPSTIVLFGLTGMAMLFIGRRSRKA